MNLYLSWIATGILGLLTFYSVKWFMKMRSLPPGPFPLPIIGNLLAFRGKGVVAQEVMIKYGKKYNNIYTLWMGPNPTVVITSWDLCKEALITKKSDFSGRVEREMNQLLLDGNFDVIMSDYGPCWETLRKLLVTAVRKYYGSEKLAGFVVDVVDNSVEQITKEEKPIETLNFIYLIVFNVLATSAFGHRYEMDDPEFVALWKGNEDYLELVQKILPLFVVPFLKPFYKKEFKQVKDIFDVGRNITKKKYIEHKESYQTGVVRDFIDALLFAKEEAEAEGKECQKFLIDENNYLVLMDFFQASMDNIKTNLLWIFLIVCNDPEVQRRIQAEIDKNIGTRVPRQEDKLVCPYTYAVILESLRFRPVINTTIDHKTICNTELGGHKIPKNTSCLFHILNVHRDETLWKDADMFKPERFLDENGHLLNKRFEGYMPFGLGHRACPGDKLATAYIFLLITRLLQQVNLELETGPGTASLDVEPQNFISLPKQYNIFAKKRN